MRTPLLAFLLLGASLFLLPALPSHILAQEPAEDQDPVDEDSDPAEELVQAGRELKLAELRMGLLLYEQDLGRMQADIEHQSALAELESYNLHQGEASRVLADLELRYEQDSLADAEEELQQLGIMYDHNNLADVTAQIVMDRATRDVERQKESVALAVKELQHFLQYREPLEKRELGNAVRLAAAELPALHARNMLDLTELEMEIEELKQRIKELQNELEESGD